MKSVGMGLWSAGLLIFLFAVFGMETTVSSDSTLFGSSRTYNIGLQQGQLIASMAGLTFFLSGSIIHALAALFDPAAKVSLPIANAVFSDQIGSEQATENFKSNGKDKRMGYGVSKDGDQYVFGQYRYDNLSDAIRYARDHQSERT
jgi:hypothetical protein